MDKIIEKILDDVKDKELIEFTKKNQLNDWLNLVFSNDNSKLFIDYMFPSDDIRHEYLNNIESFSDDDVKRLLRKFLITNGIFDSDYISLSILFDAKRTDKKLFRKMMENEYYIRLLKSAISKKNIVWEGNTWILEHLPNRPKYALESLNYYLIANIQFLPDGAINGIFDAMRIIRAKYINSGNYDSILLNLDPHDFEDLIVELYSEKGYEILKTQKSQDGGVDIIASKDEVSNRETLIIQCKRSKNNISVTKVRELMGVLNSTFKATKAVFVTNSKFTSFALKEFSDNPSIEFIDGKNLKILLNKNFGPYWPLDIDIILLKKVKEIFPHDNSFHEIMSRALFAFYMEENIEKCVNILEDLLEDLPFEEWESLISEFFIRDSKKAKSILDHTIFQNLDPEKQFNSIQQLIHYELFDDNLKNKIYKLNPSEEIVELIDSVDLYHS